MTYATYLAKLEDRRGAAQRPGAAQWTYDQRPSVACCDCGAVFSDAVAPLHAERLGHRMGTPSLLPSGEVAA